MSTSSTADSVITSQRQGSLAKKKRKRKKDEHEQSDTTTGLTKQQNPHPDNLTWVAMADRSRVKNKHNIHSNWPECFVGSGSSEADRTHDQVQHAGCYRGWGYGGSFQAGRHFLVQNLLHALKITCKTKWACGQIFFIAAHPTDAEKKSQNFYLWPLYLPTIQSWSIFYKNIRLLKYR